MPEKAQNNGLKGIICGLMLLLPLTQHVMAQNDDYLAGCAMMVNRDYPAAIEKFTLAIGYNNASERTYLKRGEAFVRTGAYEKAIMDFEEANQIYPGVSEFWLAKTYALSGDQARAIGHLKSHLSSDFRLSEDSIKKDPDFDNLQQSNEWYALWEREWFTAEEKAAADVAYYMKKGMPDKALDLMNNEIAASPGSVKLLINRGKVSMQQGNQAAAISDFNQAAGTDKKNRTAQADVGGLEEIYALRGLAYLKAGKFKEAAGDFSRAIKEKPEDFVLYLNRARASAGMRDWEAAIRDAQTYLRYFPNDGAVIYQCGTYYYDAEDYMNALKYFNRNLKEDPNNSLYYKARGMTYIKTATYRYAVNDLSMSLDLNPEDAETWMYLGVAKIFTGDQENGCSDLEKARQLGSTEAVRYMLERCK
jgi:tetratricopeptide (TPR) repeat protein